MPGARKCRDPQAFALRSSGSPTADRAGSAFTNQGLRGSLGRSVSHWLLCVGNSKAAVGPSRLPGRRGSWPAHIRVYIRNVRPALDRATILWAGCELARRDGLEAVGVRSVAGVVGATPMALYRYVSDATDLRDAVLARLCESLPGRPESVHDVPRWARTFRTWLIDVPGLSRLVLIRWFEIPPLLDIVEALLRVFNQVGLEGFELVAAANSLFAYVLSRGELEEAVRASGVLRSLPWDEGATERPLLNSLRDEYEVARLDEHFNFGLELLLRGLLGHASRAAR